MKRMQMTSKSILCALVVAGLSAATQPAAAAVYNLRAASTTVTLADGSQVPMWGFGLTDDLTVSVPGPILEVPPGDDTLIVNLTNELPVPVSIVIPGIPAPLTPVWDDGTSGPRTNLGQRAVSFTYVAQPGETVAYQWSNVQPGTYLYQSGTHPAVQVPMGLYGAVRHDAIPEQTYGVAYDEDLVLVYSEIDPALNSAVSDGSYGTASYPSTIAYRPRYFLINGQERSNAPVLEQNVNQRLLLRVVNAGLQTIVPTLTSGRMRLLAEDGQPAPFVRESYAMLLPAGKTRDALLVLTEPGSTALFDRSGGTLLSRINAVSVLGAPVAAADVYAASADTPLDTTAAALPGVLANDTGMGLSALLSSSTSAGTLQLAADGSFLYAPAQGFSGVDTFSYFATDGLLSSNVVTVSIHVAAGDHDASVPVHDASADGMVGDAGNTPPLTAGDYAATLRNTAVIIDVLANDSDSSGTLDPTSVTLTSKPTRGGTATSLGDGTVRYEPRTNFKGTDTFTYVVSDALGAVSEPATVRVNVTTP